MEQLAPIEIDPKTFLRQHCALPALPDVVSKIQKVVSGDNVNMGEVVDSISSDPALVAQILKVANSSYYSLPSEVSNIRFAITFLGINEIYRMVLSLTVVNALSVKEKDLLNKFWFHSFYTALSVKFLAKKYEPQMSPDDLWSASILHDIGKLVYLKFFPDHFKALINFSKENGCLFNEAERHFSLPSSSFLGTLLCDHWGLPGKISDACESHDLMDLANLKGNSSTERFKRMICLGNLTSILATEELAEAKKQEIAGAIKTSLDCSDADFMVLMGDIYEFKTDVEEFMRQLS